MSKSVKSAAKILLADDSVTMHRAVTLGLKKEPFEVLYCDNGQDALRLTREHRPLIVLADLDMPGLTGAELCQTIKNDPELSADTKVILLCGSFDQIDEKAIEKIPADARLWKPFESHVLVSMIHTLLKVTPKQGAEITAQMARPKLPTQNLQRPAEETEDISLPPLPDFPQASSPHAGSLELGVSDQPTSQIPLPGTRRTPPPPPPVQAKSLPTMHREAEKTAPLRKEEVHSNLWSSDFDALSENPSRLREQTLGDGPLSSSTYGDTPDSSSGPEFELVGTPKEALSSRSVTESLGSPSREATEAFQGFGVESSSTGLASLGDAEVREVVREEIQKAFNSYLKEGLERRLRDVIAQIERLSKS